MAFKGWGAVGLGVLSLVLAVGTAKADTAGATAAYKRGQQYQAAKQWGPAVKEYQAALQQDPNYYWAYKALGTTYYQGGDRKGALAYYDRYLAKNPSDTATKAFAEKLRAEVGGAAPAPAAATAAAGSGGAWRPGWSLGLGAGALMSDGSDMAKFFASTAKVKPGSAMGLGFDVEIDYALANGFVMGAQLIFGPNRSHPVDNSSGGITNKVTLGASHMGFFLSPGYRFKTGKTWWLEPHLGLGYLTSSLVITSEFGFGGGTLASTTTYPGSGFGAWPELRVVKNFGSFSGLLGLGYFWSTAGPFKDPITGKNLQAAPAAGSTKGEDWTMSTTGLALRAGLTYHFSPPL